jgi:uncharacterized protein YacL
VPLFLFPVKLLVMSERRADERRSVPDRRQGGDRRAGDRRATDRRRATPLGGVILVELIRMVVVVLFAAAGYAVGRTSSKDPRSPLVLIEALLGCALGYVAGGVFGRTVGRMAGVAESRIAAIPGADIVASALGAMCGLLMASVFGWPLLLLPSRTVGVPVLVFLLVVFGYLGFRIALIKREDILQLLGLSFRTRAGDLRVLDTSAILDSRLLDLVRAGLLRGTLLVPTFVLEEAQGIADSADTVRRRRAHQGLEALAAIRRDGLADVRSVEKVYPEFEDVDAKVVALARERGASLVTDDAPLARIAELQGIEVLLIRRIAAAIRPQILPGEVVHLELTRAGKSPGQAVGYLDDGTMVVVESAGDHLGESLDVRIARAVPTSGGRMLFAHLEVPSQEPRG